MQWLCAVYRGSVVGCRSLIMWSLHGRVQNTRSHSCIYSHIYMQPPTPSRLRLRVRRTQEPVPPPTSSAPPTSTPDIYADNANVQISSRRHTRPTQPAQLRSIQDLRCTHRRTQRSPGSRDSVRFGAATQGQIRRRG
jgi:hypothetical protein